MTSTAIARTLSDLDVDLSQSEFFGDVASTFAGALEDSIGLVEASSFVGEVGDQLGTEIGDEYRR